MKSTHTIWNALFILMMIAGTLGAEVYKISIPHYRVNPGDTVKVPVSLDNASNLAQLRVQINYDPQVVRFVSATTGPLGAQFDFTYEDDEGSIVMDFVRAESLVVGAGQLAVLEFQANAGATVDLYSDLAIAKFEIGDDSGVRDITVQSKREIVNGSVSVSLAKNIDNASNGLPDWWEKQYGLNVMRQDAAVLDDDNDGLKNILEYLFGANPHVRDSVTYGPKLALDSDHRFLTISYQRRKGKDGERLSVWESENLETWWKLDPESQMTSPPEDLGNGFERVTLRGLLPIGGNDGKICDFLRIKGSISE